jgi:hypothetical protein
MKAGKLQHRVTRTRVKGGKLPELGSYGGPSGSGESWFEPRGAIESATLEYPVRRFLLFAALCEVVCTDERWLAVGESFERYRIRILRIRGLGRDRTNYKTAADFRAPKLLFRMTGIGILASIDYHGMYTNQVPTIVASKEPAQQGQQLQTRVFSRTDSQASRRSSASSWWPASGSRRACNHSRRRGAC